MASPLGAWLLLALCGPASTGATREKLAEALGMDVTAAAAAAAELVDHPHPLVPAATAVWHQPGYDTSELHGWRVSVAAADVQPGDVLAAAYELAPTADDRRPAGRRSLFDLLLGECPLWTIREKPVITYAAGGREEHCNAALPCWSARSDHDLSAAVLGFPTATQVLAPLMGMTSLDFAAGQAAVARYSRYGFEAAAVTGFATITSAPNEMGTARIAELRFGSTFVSTTVRSPVPDR